MLTIYCRQSTPDSSRPGGRRRQGPRWSSCYASERVYFRRLGSSTGRFSGPLSPRARCCPPTGGACLSTTTRRAPSSRRCGVCLILLQAALIGALLLERRRRPKAELAVQLQHGQIAHASRLSLAGELTASDRRDSRQRRCRQAYSAGGT